MGGLTETTQTCSQLLFEDALTEIKETKRHNNTTSFNRYCVRFSVPFFPKESKLSLPSIKSLAYYAEKRVCERRTVDGGRIL